MTTASPEYVDRGRQYQSDYYRKNREKKLAYAREQRAQRRDEINARRRELAHAAGVQPRTVTGIKAADKKEHNRKYHLEVKAEKNLIEKYTALAHVSKTGAVECGVCKEDDIRVLTVNHINGGGRTENAEFGLLRKRINSGERDVSDLEVRCFNCNIRYEYDRGRARLPSNWREVLAKLKGG